MTDPRRAGPTDGLEQPADLLGRAGEAALRPGQHAAGPRRRRSRPRKRKRRAGAEVDRPTGPVTPYAELHCHSNFSFLDGASGPDELVEEAVRLGLHGLALTDHDGFYGAPLFAETAQLHADSRGAASRRSTVPSCRWAAAVRRTASPTPRAATCWCWPAASRATTGWPPRSPTRSCAATRRVVRSTTSTSSPSAAAGHWLVLTGCRKGAVRQALADRWRDRRAAAELDRLTGALRARRTSSSS